MPLSNYVLKYVSNVDFGLQCYNWFSTTNYYNLQVLLNENKYNYNKKTVLIELHP